MERKEITTKNGEKLNLLVEDPLTLRRVLKEVLDTSCEGFDGDCLCCASINELVCHFVQDGFFTVYRLRNYVGNPGIDIHDEWIELGHFMRKEFAEEEVEKRKKVDEENNYVGHNYEIEEVKVKI